MSEPFESWALTAASLDAHLGLETLGRMAMGDKGYDAETKRLKEKCRRLNHG